MRAGRGAPPPPTGWRPPPPRSSSPHRPGPPRPCPAGCRGGERRGARLRSPALNRRLGTSAPRAPGPPAGGGRPPSPNSTGELFSLPIRWAVVQRARVDKSGARGASEASRQTGGGGAGGRTARCRALPPPWHCPPILAAATAANPRFRRGFIAAAPRPPPRPASRLPAPATPGAAAPEAAPAPPATPPAPGRLPAWGRPGV